MSSSTSSSDRPAGWRRFFALFLASTAGLGGAIFLWVIVVDPFDTLILSPPLDRVPIASNARFSFPALARSDAFDSAVVGTSTSRLLRPEKLGAFFGARFVNLSMNSATAYEQSRVLDLFVRHHPDAKVVLLGADIAWCTIGRIRRYTERPFPEWMYDDNPWNDFAEHFNFYTLEQAGRQFATMLGLRPVKYGRDGYTNFLPDQSHYDLERARKNTWDGRQTQEPLVPPEPMSAEERAALDFPAHALLSDLLSELPAASRKIVYFAPYHVAGQPRPGSRGEGVWEECKARIAGMAARYENMTVVDFMVPSPITTRDENYWDRLHYNVEIAELIESLIAQAANGQAESSYFRLLTMSNEDQEADELVTSTSGGVALP